MVFDLLHTPIHFELNVGGEEYVHDIVVCPYEHGALIDGVQLSNVSLEHSFENSKFLLSNETVVINGQNSEGLDLQYNLTLEHSFGENGEDIYTPISFFQAK